MIDTKDLALSQNALDIKRDFEVNLTIPDKEMYAPALQEQLTEIEAIVNNNYALPDLYAPQLAKTKQSQSNFLAMCVQFGEHGTPNRKLKQALIEMRGKLDALHTAKIGRKKAIVTVDKLKTEIETLTEVYKTLEATPAITEEIVYKLSSIDNYYYNNEKKEEIVLIPNFIIDKVMNLDIVDKPVIISGVMQKVKSLCGIKITEYEDAVRNLDSSKDMIKDAAMAANHLKQLVDEYDKQTEAYGLSYEESEMVYFVHYFTRHFQFQVLTGDHQIDRGTMMAIGQMPMGLRNKIFSNIQLIKARYMDKENPWPMDADWIINVHPELFEPEITRLEDGSNLVEGVSVKEFLMVTDDRVFNTNTKAGE